MPIEINYSVSSQVLQFFPTMKLKTQPLIEKIGPLFPDNTTHDFKCLNFLVKRLLWFLFSFNKSSPIEEKTPTLIRLIKCRQNTSFDKKGTLDYFLQVGAL